MPQVFINVADATSSLEIGTAGGAAAGSVTIDSGVTTTVAGSFQAPSIVDNGTIIVAAGSALNLLGALSGTGQIDIGSGADLYLQGPAAAANSIAVAFEGTGDVLTISSAVLDSSQNFAPVISGLNASDAIDLQGMTATSASYNNGLLTLLNGVTPVAYLHLSGNYAGAAFYALGNGQSTTQVGILTGGDTSTAPAGTSGADNYVWAGAVEGSWDVAGNWNDTTAGLSPASVAPGGNDNVTIGSLGNALSDVITGTGNSASLTIAGAAILDGQFTTGKLVMGTSTTVFGGIVLDSGASLLVTGDVTGGITERQLARPTRSTAAHSPSMAYSTRRMLRFPHRVAVIFG